MATALVLTFVAVLLTSCTNAAALGGACVPGRYLLVVLPLLLPGTAHLLARGTPAARAHRSTRNPRGPSLADVRLSTIPRAYWTSRPLPRARRNFARLLRTQRCIPPAPRRTGANFKFAPSRRTGRVQRRRSAPAPLHTAKPNRRRGPRPTSPPRPQSDQTPITQNPKVPALCELPRSCLYWAFTRAMGSGCTYPPRPGSSRVSGLVENACGPRTAAPGC